MSSHEDCRNQKRGLAGANTIAHSQPCNMSDSMHSQKKVHDIYPDEPEDPGAHQEGRTVIASVNHARRRPSRVPRPTSESYLAFKAKQDCALKIGVHGLQEEITKSTGVRWTELVKEKLTVHFRSQSKLSQQELSDLQKATHFDKKELQQWYKGMLSDRSATAVQATRL